MEMPYVAGQIEDARLRTDRFQKSALFPHKTLGIPSMGCVRTTRDSMGRRRRRGMGILGDSLTPSGVIETIIDTELRWFNARTPASRRSGLYNKENRPGSRGTARRLSHRMNNGTNLATTQTIVNKLIVDDCRKSGNPGDPSSAFLQFISIEILLQSSATALAEDACRIAGSS